MRSVPATYSAYTCLVTLLLVAVTSGISATSDAVTRSLSQATGVHDTSHTIVAHRIAKVDTSATIRHSRVSNVHLAAPHNTSATTMIIGTRPGAPDIVMSIIGTVVYVVLLLRWQVFAGHHFEQVRAPAPAISSIATNCAATLFIIVILENQFSQITNTKERRAANRT